MFLLDTDHLGIIQRQTQPEFSRLMGRIGMHQPTEFFVSIISFHEQVAGWNAWQVPNSNATARSRQFVRFGAASCEFIDCVVRASKNAAENAPARVAFVL